MTSIVPTVTAETAEGYTSQLQEVVGFAPRVHVDLMDGSFAPTKSVGLDQVWWPGNIRVDLHVMYDKPFKHTDLFVDLGPQLVIVHAESTGNFAEFANTLHRHGVEVGIALLPETPVASVTSALDLIDHVLIFSGNLGHQGGSTADMKLLDKAKELRKLKPTLEIGWDGGVNETNAAQIAAAGIDVLDVGGFIRKGKGPQQQYEKLKKAVGA